MIYFARVTTDHCALQDSASHLWVGLRCVDVHLLDHTRAFRFSNHGSLIQQLGTRVQDVIDVLDIESNHVRPNCMHLRADGSVDANEDAPLVSMANSAECNRQVGHISVESDVWAMLRFIFARLVNVHTFTWSTQLDLNIRLKGVTMAEAIAALPKREQSALPT